LETARQVKNESPQQFNNRCKNLAQKVMIKSSFIQIQRIHKENADRMLLASFVSGLTGTAVYQVRISHPKFLGLALNLKVYIQEADRQERFNESFYTWSEKSVRLLSEPKSRPDSGNGNCKYSGETHVYRQTRRQRQSAPLVKIGHSTRRTEKPDPKLP